MTQHVDVAGGKRVVFPVCAGAGIIRVPVQPKAWRHHERSRQRKGPFPALPGSLDDLFKIVR
jgi:hypothetical protein